MKVSTIEHPRLKSGDWSYISYRYGPSQPVKLAPIFTGEKRKEILSQAMNILRKWDTSPFENEASTRHGLRTGLCERGYGWQRADNQAKEIVADGLRLIGAKRPTWEQGQREYTDPRENCTWCKRAFSDEELHGARRPRFCSAECARAAVQYRDWETSYIATNVGRMARHVILKQVNPKRTCLQCKATFGVISVKSPQVYCSTVCANKANGYLPDKACRHCEKNFHPKIAEQEFCSRTCLDRNGRVPQHLGQCDYCAKWFLGKLSKSRLCSTHCRSMDYHYRVKQIRPRQMVPAAFDYFVAAECVGVRQLTPARFDRFFCEAA